MNEISLLNSWLLEHFNNNVLVNTISTVKTLEMDFNKENIYPLFNLDIKTSDILNDVIIVEYTITILQQRDDRPIKIDSKLLENTNYIDNINETHSIAQRLINVLSKQNNTSNIEIQELSTLRFLKNYSASNCDGVQFDINLSTPNIGSSC